ncbi:hypothetical protein VP1G_04799 [Cytospora mali]|uniref:Uncharacterized protein n=1 Tax=Cytospora mali TaxID=578113 RepID=A0A194V0P6_CYTMA|nr:hypothetical protein VP1G_04799 [Valsa mali var. pyri (nom. inval.)]
MKKSQAKTGKAILARPGLRSPAAAAALVLVALDPPEAVVPVAPAEPVSVPDAVSAELEAEEPEPPAPPAPPEIELAPDGVDPLDVALPVLVPPEPPEPPEMETETETETEPGPVADGVELGDGPELADDATELADDAAELAAVELPDVDVAEVPNDVVEALVPVPPLESDAELAVLDPDTAEDPDPDAVDKMLIDWVVEADI